ncbi:sigma-70 family RNA polymerase sigma factor [Chryseolinea sp. T2]|uniref:RNA polymerase sigma factor n=1 Tax=Chryseolinea sp. T2 TaxID=3129255 RepID=UPI003077D5C8
MVDDRALVRRIQDGDMHALRVLIRQHERLVQHMVGRVVANEVEREELCQDVFLKVYNSLGTFAFQSKLSTWIATIAYRHALNHLRGKRSAMLELPTDDSTAVFVETQTPETAMSESDLNDHVKKLIERLPLQYKMIINLYHIEEMSYAEIGTIMELPEGTVKSYLFRARAMLKEYVKKYI